MYVCAWPCASFFTQIAKGFHERNSILTDITKLVENCDGKFLSEPTSG